MSLAAFILRRRVFPARRFWETFLHLDFRPSRTVPYQYVRLQQGVLLPLSWYWANFARELDESPQQQLASKRFSCLVMVLNAPTVFLCLVLLPSVPSLPGCSVSPSSA